MWLTVFKKLFDWRYTRTKSAVKVEEELKELE